jgi:hypothetical protein
MSPGRVRRRLLLGAGAALVIAGAVSAAVATVGHSRGVKLVAVKPHSLAVIDPKKNVVVSDIPTGSYPGPLTADDKFVYVCNIGDGTVSRILAKAQALVDTQSFSRAIDMIANDLELWSANGGAPGHTPFNVGPGTVSVWRPGPTVQTIRVGPSMNGDEEQTTIAADGPLSYSVWVGNKDSRTVRQLDRALGSTLITIHGIAPGGLAAVGNSSAGDTVWASEPARDIVARIDEHARSIVRRIPVANEPSRIAADNDAVWVIARDRNGPGEWRPTRGTSPALWHINAKTNKVVARIPLPLTPIRVALGVDSVWVTGVRAISTRGTSVDATVFRIDPNTDRIVARIPLRTNAVDGIIVSHGLVWAAIPASQ